MTGGIVVGPAIMGRDITVTLPPSVPLALSGLPAASPAFTGRREDLAEILEVLKPRSGSGETGEGPAAVVVSAVGGMGGVGKTELAVQAARTALAAGWFPGGVLFADLFGYDDDRRRDPSAVLETMLRAVGVPPEHIPPDRGGRVAMYRSVLAEFARVGRRVLVVADNTNNTMHVEMLLPTDGVCAAIVTSRHTLAMLNARLLDLNVPPPAEAEEMLARVIEVALPGDSRIAGHPEDAAELVEVCGRLPLAVRIVGALLAEDPALPIAQLTRELKETTPLAGLRYGTEGVGKAFALSYRALSAEQQRVFRMLTINPGPDTSTQAAAVLTGLAEPAARNLLRDLARAHLIEPAEGYGRWRMHDLIRAYATGLSDQDSDRDEALDRLLGFYLTTTRAASAHLDPTEQDPATYGFADREHALSWLDTEWPNLTAAVHAITATHPGIAIRLPLALAYYLDWRRLFNDQIALTEIALDAARHLGHRSGEVAALNNLGNALTEVRRFEEAITIHQTIAAIYRVAGDRPSEDVALNNLGNALAAARRYEEAITTLQRDLVICHELGDRRREAAVLSNLGIVLTEVERFEEAVTIHQEAAAVFGELGDRHSEGKVLANLGVGLQNVGRSDEAVTAFHKAAVNYREAGDRHGEGMALNNLGNALGEARRFDDAIEAYQNAAAIFGEVGDRHSEGAALHNLGYTLQDMRRFEDAIEPYRDAAAAYRETGDRHSEGLTSNNLGLVLTEVQRFEEAIDAYRQAVVVAAESEDRHGQAVRSHDLAVALTEVGRLDEAEAVCAEAVALFGEVGDEESHEHALQTLAWIQEQGDDAG